ncbi:hypothetical protein HZF24_04215 [Sedimentibacter hydroxybenzoicus DSM 7310]|uniref:Uncharacterized protein n=1 Tax=Sedimentibacter hydroxybenzoicus DSM 7310 TaxID=1123245 RepID=A0A974BHM0_SEDHY|nr:hypothetical protein [Sedimentibacter hydroxybenzoicus]NYB73339.1 hypothetical protein [Sedimentibacter hydroxybenzoicus DSM 7310]
MYEMRKRKQREMQQKNWWSYALLAAAIFVYTQGCSLIKTNMGYSLPVILLSFIMHLRSVGDLSTKIFKLKESKTANIAMLIALTAVAVICYLKELNIFYILLLNIAAIFIYIIAAAIFSKHNKEQ